MGIFFPWEIRVTECVLAHVHIQVSIREGLVDGGMENTQIPRRSCRLSRKRIVPTLSQGKVKERLWVKGDNLGLGRCLDVGCLSPLH